MDLQQLVEARFVDAPLYKVLDALTEPRDLGWTKLNSVCYIGPGTAADELATLLTLATDSVEKFPTATKVRWMQQVPANWPRLSQPREILAIWLSNQDIRLENGELVTHDLWQASQTPPLPLIDRVVLLLVGFDLTCEISSEGRLCAVAPIERPVVITRNYEANSRARAAIARLSRDQPDFEITRQGRGLTAKGRWEDHLKLVELLAGTKSPDQSQETTPPKPGRQLFSLKLENQPLGNVITQLARQIGLRVVWDDDHLEQNPEQGNQLVTCEVVEADLPTLLSQICDPVGLDFRLEEDTLYLKKRDP